MIDSTATPAPLEDLMAAMDVVDTLRHQQGIAERELDTEQRRHRLLERLNELYLAQGIEVPEHILQEGIDALEQGRFKYQPVAQGWQTRLARVWVSRRRWSKPVGFLAILGSLFSGIYFVADVLPERKQRASLPVSIENTLGHISRVARNPEIAQGAQSKATRAAQLLAADDLPGAREILAELKGTLRGLQTSYVIRVVARPDSSSGVWRVPDVNQSGRNYYLIVEAIDSANNVIELEILNEETNKTSKQETWGIRVDEETFYRVAADKNDDGIIQRNQVGEKLVGYLKPNYSIATTGGKITRWD